MRSIRSRDEEANGQRGGGSNPSEVSEVSPGEEHVAEEAARFFKCPDCGAEISLLHLVTFWNEWGLICYCARCGCFDPNCRAFPVDEC